MKQVKKPKPPKGHTQHSASGSGTLSAGKRPNPKKPAPKQHSASGSGTLSAHHKAPKHPHQPQRAARSKARQWSPGADVACCAAEAFGAVVVASGRPWSAERTLALYNRTAPDLQYGASLLDTLLGARAFWPRLDAQPLDVCLSDGSSELNDEVGVQDDLVRLLVGHGLILGVALPEPHAVAVTPDGRWWSWGEPFNAGDWPELVIEEAWAVLL